MPVIYPNPSSNIDLYIHDDFHGTLIKHPGSMGSFFCDNCPTDVTLYTTSNRVDILVSWLNRQGYIRPFKEEVDIRALETNRHYNEPANGSATVAVSISPLPSTIRMELLATSGNWLRRIKVVKDTQPTRIQIEFIQAEETPQEMLYMVLISFSKKVVWKPEPVACPQMRRVTRHTVNASLLLDQSSLCEKNLLNSDIRKGISVRGGNSRMIIWNGGASIVIPITIGNKTKSEDVEIEVKEGFTDYAGQSVKGGQKRILYYRPFPPIRERQGRLLARDVTFPLKTYFNGKIMGQVATVMVAGTSAVTFATSASSTRSVSLSFLVDVA